MSFEKYTKCLWCGTRDRKTISDSPLEHLKPDGEFVDYPFWYCSSACFKKAAGEYVDNPRYGFDKSADKDPEIDEHLENLQKEFQLAVGMPHHPLFRTEPVPYMKSEFQRLKAEFDKQQYIVCATAANRLWDHLLADIKWELAQEEEKDRIKAEKERILLEKQAERELEQREKQAERERLERERKQEREERERQRILEKQQLDRERKEERELRDKERREYYEQRDRERREEREREQREKEEAKRLEQEAEDAKWKPKPFKL